MHFSGSILVKFMNEKHVVGIKTNKDAHELEAFHLRERIFWKIGKIFPKNRKTRKWKKKSSLILKQTSVHPRHRHQVYFPFKMPFQGSCLLRCGVGFEGLIKHKYLHLSVRSLIIVRLIKNIFVWWIFHLSNFHLKLNSTRHESRLKWWKII